ncbi:hypothetical protein SAY87_019191 [Trapa incisa]|uniref:Germin-like protein n=2 Tax=Trapa TaxID=22665 RepID=A0AAN7LVV5_TRANT|nr:hypothetical protein SAY87_019191 [Trapa incisa]KAK4793590.1 hypothetical protein SAY86_024025 [Trapa natans]
MALQALLVFSLLVVSSTTTNALLQDFCVADPAAPMSPDGFSCKSLDKVTVDDFVFSGLDQPGNTSALVNSSFVPAFVTQLPGLNGLGLSLARADLESGGVFPMHSHPSATESFVVVKGSLTAGFISSTANTVYSKVLKAGDVFVVPPGLLHYVINTGADPAQVFVAFSSPRPGIQLADLAWFKSDLPSSVIQATTFLDPDQIKKLKALFGGTN